MGYACPVCETPHPDAEHLANHLAFTAMLGDGDHEAWLDDHAPGWADEGEDELAARVEDHAKEVGFPQVFDDTTRDHGHDEPRGGELFEDDPERAGDRGREPTAGSAGGAEALDGEAREILQEAREMTREMLGDEGGGDAAEDEKE